MPEQNNNSECAGDTTIKKWLNVENQGPEWHSLSQLFYNTNFKTVNKFIWSTSKCLDFHELLNEW